MTKISGAITFLNTIALFLFLHLDKLKVISYNKANNFYLYCLEGIMSTKDRILEEALTLFAENGYDGTGVEQIAEKVGIKAPSLYKHFKGKEDIMTALIDSAEERYEESFGSEQHIGEIPENREDFLRSTMGRIAFTMHVYHARPDDQENTQVPCTGAIS